MPLILFTSDDYRTPDPGRTGWKRQALATKGDGMGGLLWAVIAVLLVMWLAGTLLHFAGGLIHLLLVVAAVLFVVNMFLGGRTRV